MRKTVVIIVLFLMHSEGSGQAIFQKTYSTPGYNSYGVSIAEGPQGHFMVLNGTNQPGIPQSSGTMLMRTDPDGTTLWAKQYQVAGALQDWAAHIAHAGNERYLLTLNHNFPDSSSIGYAASSINLIDSVGSVLWTTALHDIAKQIDYVLKKTLRIGSANFSVGTTNIAFHVNPYTDTTKLGLVVKTDTQGNLLWAKNYGTYGTKFNDIVATDDGGMVIVGITETPVPIGQYIKDLIYLKLDSAGDVIWSNKWNWPNGGDVYCVAKAKNGFLIGGVHIPIINENAFMLKIDINGSLVWSTEYTGNGSSSIRIEDIYELPSGDIMFLTNRSLKIADSSGFNPKYYYSSTLVNQNIASISVSSDSSILSVGSSSLGISFHKIDYPPSGCVNLCCVVAASALTISVSGNAMSTQPINVASHIFTLSTTSLQVSDSVHCITSTNVNNNTQKFFAPLVSPNPFVNSLSIDLNIESAQEILLSVYNINGQLIAHKTTSYQRIVELELSHLNRGMYVLLITDGFRVYSTKILKL